MMSMTSIIAALASKADFTFLDEPEAGMDTLSREKFYQMLLDEFSDSGRAFVIATHLIDEVSDLTEEVIFLDFHLKSTLDCRQNTPHGKYPTAAGTQFPHQAA